MKKFLLLSMICYLTGISYQAAWAATYYMPDNFANLHAAFAGMQGEDELIIRDGTYTGDENTISRHHFPPHGTDTNWTTIKAEHDGKVYFGDPNSTDQTFYVEFHHDSYVQFEGLVWLGGCHVGAVSYVKFLRCGSGTNIVNQASLPFRNNVSHHILYEDCYAWGGGRYMFSTQTSEHIIFRRCVARIDAVNTTHGDNRIEPIGGVAFYGSSNCEAQNCILIDSDTEDFWIYYSLIGAFTTPNTGGDNNFFRGCIDLHGDMPLHGQHSKYTNTHRINNIGWDLPSGSLLGGETDYEHLTIGNISTWLSYAAVDGHTDNGCTVQNSLFVNISARYGAVENIVDSDRNYFYNNVLNYNHATPGAHDLTNINPLIHSLLYLPRIESNSDLSGKASDGGDVGATVMKRIGVNGTLWGEPGYNTTTDKDLWPWPNEDIIKMNLRTYSHPQINGARGFCADGKQLNGIDDITLTTYIWEYLGNPIPPEIYGGQRSNKNPHANAGPDQELTDSDDNGEEQVTLNASASYDPDGTISSYVWSENGTQIAVGVRPTITLDVATHLISLAVTDNDNATKTDEVRIEIVAAEGDQTPPVISNQEPVADAGEDQYLTDIDDNGKEQVTLNASASYDPDGTISSYVWSENGTQIAVGVSPTITLDVDTHLISLAVTDNDNATKTDEVRIEIEPTEGDQTPPVISNVQSGNSTSTSATISWDTDEPSTSIVLYGLTSSYGHRVENVDLVLNHEVVLSGLEASTTYHFQVISKDGNDNVASSSDFTCSAENQGTTSDSLQDFEDGILWQPGGSQDPTGNGRGWAFLSPGAGDKIEIDNIGANGSSHSLKLTFASSNDTLYFRSNDKITDRMPEAAGANRMSFYVRFPEGFPIQPLPFRYDTWQLGTFIHNPDNWSDTHRVTSESDHGIHHYYHRVTIEQIGNGWVKYIFNTHPDQANYSGSTAPPNIPYYYDNFGRFYFQFGQAAGGPEPPRPFTIWIDEIKFYYDDGTIGGQVHDGGQDDAGFDGQFIPDSYSGFQISAPTGVRVVEEIK